MRLIGKFRLVIVIVAMIKIYGVNDVSFCIVYTVYS